MGMKLHIYESGEGEPLVLLHGLFGTGRNLGVLIRALSPFYRVLAMDLRNHGESPHDPEMDYAVMAADVAETLAQKKLTSVRLCGHSMGGKTAMMLALKWPELVSHLAVMDIAPVTYGHNYAHFVTAMQAIPLTPTLTRAQAEQTLARVVKEAPLRAFLLNNLVLGAAPYWRMGLDEIGANMGNLFRWDDPPHVVPYAGPTLFLCGAQSDYVMPSAKPSIMQRFPQACISYVPNAAHWLHADQPELVTTALKEFFAA